MKEKAIEGKRQNVNDPNRTEQAVEGNQRGVPEPVRQIGLVGEAGQGAGGQG